MSLILRGPIYWIDIRHGGKRVRKTTGTSDQALAQRLHDQVKASLWANENLATPMPRTFAEAIDKWLSENSHKKYLAEASLNLSWLNDRIGSAPLTKITEQVIEGMIEEKKTKGLSNATVNRTLSALSVVLRSAVKWKWIDQAPPIRRLEERKHTGKFFTREQVVGLIAELPWHLALIFSFALVTGQRMSNILGLQWSRVDVEGGHFWIDTDEFKSGSAHSVPLSLEAVAILALCQGVHPEYVFTFRGKRLQRVSSQCWYESLERAGLPRGRANGFTFHSTRHTWASFHTMNGTPRAALQALGGWKTSAMVDKYSHLAPGYAAVYAGNSKITR